MTNEEINALTDQQINVMMARAVNELDESWDQSMNGKFLFYCPADGASDTNSSIPVEDYCNDPDVIWKIIDELTIDGGIIQITRMGVILSLVSGGRVECMNENKGRAVAIVYLKMKGVL